MAASLRLGPTVKAAIETETCMEAPSLGSGVLAFSGPGEGAALMSMKDMLAASWAVSSSGEGSDVMLSRGALAGCTCSGSFRTPPCRHAQQGFSTPIACARESCGHASKMVQLFTQACTSAAQRSFRQLHCSHKCYLSRGGHGCAGPGRRGGQVDNGGVVCLLAEAVNAHQADCTGIAADPVLLQGPGSLCRRAQAQQRCCQGEGHCWAPPPHDRCDVNT